MEAVQITDIKDRLAKGSGRAFKIVCLSDGREIFSFDRIEGLAIGAWGNPVLKKSKKGDDVLDGFEVTKPAPMEPPGTFKNDTERVKSQAVWDAKDRANAMMASTKEHDAVLAAMISAGILKKEADIMKFHEAITLRNYELIELARQDKLATAANPFPDTPKSVVNG